MYQTLSERFEPIKVVKSSESTTVPDMCYTPREIIAKFSRGERVPLGFAGQFDSEDDPDNDKYLHNLGDDPAMLDEDPTRDPTFDFGDYVEEKFALEERQRQAKKRSKAVASQSAKRKARSEELSVSDAMRSETTSGDDAKRQASSSSRGDEANK